METNAVHSEVTYQQTQKAIYPIWCYVEDQQWEYVWKKYWIINRVPVLYRDPQKYKGKYNQKYTANDTQYGILYFCVGV